MSLTICGGGSTRLEIAFWTAPGDEYDRMGFIDDFMAKMAGPHAAVAVAVRWGMAIPTPTTPTAT